MPAVVARKLARLSFGSALLVVPFLFVARGAEALVAPLTHATVTALSRSAAVWAAARSGAEAEAPATLAADVTTASVASGGGAVTASGHRNNKAPKAKPAALFVSETTVLRLARSAARPRGSFVAQTAEHPAGLRLSGVAALGIGVQDGDILIEALGITPHSPGQIIAAVIEARSKQARLLHGTLWRQGQTFAITVEQPYLSERAPT